MPSPLQRHASASPLLLGLIGLGGAGLFLLARLSGPPRAGGAPAASVERAAPGPALPGALPGVRREPAPGAAAARARCSPTTAELPAVDTGARPAGARTEKEFLAAFLALAAESPATLEARAAEVLEGDGPEPEKAALLRALRATGSPQSLFWHEHAVRTGSDESSPQGVGLAQVALAALLRDAEDDAAACSALARLAFETPELATALRRSAATGFARHADEAELARLAAELAGEPDELLVAGALAALAERDPSAGRTRILLAHGRSDQPSAPEPER